MSSSLLLTLSFLLIGFGPLLPINQAHAGRPVRGVYSVPVAEELKEFASYPVKFDTDNYDFSSKISFPLPSALTGQEIQVTLKRVQGTQWEGTNASGSCEISDKNFTCHIEFKNLSIDAAAVERAVQSQFADPRERNGRLQVARQFSGEPIGIIAYKLRGRNRAH